ncbi:MAG: hypothetical protein HGB12_09725 [Bacteroidetes bacterium]|nr:hypothetical protein [Bacteroidota bacterium]
MKIFLFISIIISGISASFAQLVHVENINVNTNALEKCIDRINKKDSTNFYVHSAIKPLYVNEIITDSLLDEKKLHIFNFNYFKNINSISPKISHFSIKPILNILPGFSSSDNFISENNAGFSFYYIYSKMNARTKRISDFSFNMSYTIGLSDFPDYMKTQIEKTNVIPGQGYAGSSKWGYQYHNLSFYAAKNAGKHFVFETGFGKHFWGDGYRSLFLSDAAFSYPYFKITTTVRNLKYINLWTNFKDITQGYDNWFNAANKYGAFHFLSWNVTKRLNLNFFEAIIWTGKTAEHSRSFDLNYLNPIIFYRPVEFSLGGPDNALLGGGAHYKIGKKHLLYGQLLLDEFMLKEVRSGFSHLLHRNDSSIQYGSWLNKQAFQLGYKYFDVAGIKNLNFQTEYNYVRPYTYSYRVISENYGHFNQSLAHPLGANFWESVSFLRYSIKKWNFETEFMHALTGLDSNGTHFGQDIYKSTYDAYTPVTPNIVVKEYGNKVGQGFKTNINFICLKASYLIYEPMNLRIEAGYIFRNQKSVIENKTTNYIFFGIRTSIDKRYYDF